MRLTQLPATHRDMISWRQCAVLTLLAMSLLLWPTPSNAFVSTRTFGHRRSALLYSNLQTNQFAARTLDPLAVRELTEEAIQFRGEPRGLDALEKLGEHCATRVPYDFNKNQKKKDNTVLAPSKGLIPPSVTDEFLAQVRAFEENGWLSTNPDSVDGLPSLHLNLVSGGKPLADGDEESLDDFNEGLRTLLALVRPYIYDKLLPQVQELASDPSIRVSDVFLRRYGDDIGAESTARNGISAHYDIFSKVTSVIAMDDTAAAGSNGLYTTETCSTTGSTSNHASLRRFFPLEKGDGVIHSWDVLHGVDVQPDTDRTSLIVWFTTEQVLNSETTITSPWLANHPNIETDNVAQFVLASARASTDTDATDSSHDLDAAAMHHHQDASRSLPVPKSSSQHAHDLYIKSAASGNTFALTRLGSLAEEGMLSVERAKRGVAVLERLRPNERNVVFNVDMVNNDGSISFDALAKRFWLEGAVRGNQMAQAYLADEVMESAVSSGSQDLRVLAAVLFGLAAQQGNEMANESLSRVVDFEVSHCGFQSQEDFESSPVVKTAKAAMQ